MELGLLKFQILNSKTGQMLWSGRLRVLLLYLTWKPKQITGTAAKTCVQRNSFAELWKKKLKKIATNINSSSHYFELRLWFWLYRQYTIYVTVWLNITTVGNLILPYKPCAQVANCFSAFTHCVWNVNLNHFYAGFLSWGSISDQLQVIGSWCLHNIVLFPTCWPI